MKNFNAIVFLAVFSLGVNLSHAWAEEDEFGDIGKKPEASATASSGPATTVDAASAATIKGSVFFKGEAPKQKEIKMEADPNCVAMHTGPIYDQSVVLGDNSTLQNVFVYVKKGLEGKNFTAPSEPVVFDQKGCQYHPRVFGIQAGQPLEILNSDPTLHNVHAVTTVNSAFNVGMPIQGMKLKKSFAKPEQMVKIVCDVHPWMNAYVGVMGHPYFATTGQAGTFELKNLPPGEYEVVAWHEKAGSQSQTVTVAAQETKQLDFTFERSAKP